MTLAVACPRGSRFGSLHASRLREPFSWPDGGGLKCPRGTQGDVIFLVPGSRCPLPETTRDGKSFGPGVGTDEAQGRQSRQGRPRAPQPKGRMPALGAQSGMKPGSRLSREPGGCSGGLIHLVLGTPRHGLQPVIPSRGRKSEMLAFLVPSVQADEHRWSMVVEIIREVGGKLRD